MNKEHFYELIEAKTFNQVYEVRMFLERFEKEFPYNKCEKASALIKAVTGLKIVTGVWVPKQRRTKNWVRELHKDPFHK